MVAVLIIQFRLQSPLVHKDQSQYSIYINALEEVEKKYYKRLTKKSGLITIQGHEITTLEGIDFDNSSSVKIKDTSIKNLVGLPAIGNLHIPDCHELESLKGIQIKTKNIEISNCPKLKTLEGIPKNLNSLNLADAEVSLHKINKYVNSIKNLLMLNRSYVGPILSVLKIKKIQIIMIRGSNPASKSMPFVGQLIKKYYSPDGNSNASACQTELMKNGYKEYAKY
jgi:hypothetical protein